MDLGPGDLQYTLIPDQTLSNQAAATTFASFTAPFGGQADITIDLATTSTLELRVTPSGGSEVSKGLLNSGSSLTGGDTYGFTFTITAGAKYGFRVATAQSGDLVVAVVARLT